MSAHVPLGDMITDIHKVANDYAIISCKYVVVPYLPEKYRLLTDGYMDVFENDRKSFKE